MNLKFVVQRDPVARAVFVWGDGERERCAIQFLPVIATIYSALNISYPS